MEWHLNFANETLCRLIGEQQNVGHSTSALYPLWLFRFNCMFALIFSILWRIGIVNPSRIVTFLLLKIVLLFHISLQFSNLFYSHKISKYFLLLLHAVLGCSQRNSVLSTPRCILNDKVVCFCQCCLNQKKKSAMMQTKSTQISLDMIFFTSPPSLVLFLLLLLLK